MNKLWRVPLFLACLGLAVTGYAYLEATAAPIVRRARIGMPGWPAGAPPIRALLVSDIHVAGPDMPPSRLRRIVAQIDSLRPDVVLIAGDFISEKRASTRMYSMADAIAPLAELRPRFGTYAVLGNHDHIDPRGARTALAAAGIRVLDNAATRAGPLVVGGIDDVWNDRDDLPLALAEMLALPGPRLLLSHNPDPFADLPRIDPSGGVNLMLAGHTHCGQVAPWPIGPTLTMSRYGDRYACGLVREGGRALVVGAGVGTSMLPLRLGAPPDMWLLTLGPL